MPIHDWNRVSAGTFHDFHNAWITELRNAMNGGLLPSGYYAQGEQWAGKINADVLTLHAGGEVIPSGGGVAVMEDAPPRVSRRVAASEAAHVRAARRTLVIRHSSHRVVALLEIVSPANKDRPRSVQDFVDKAIAALQQGVHLLVIDLFPPGRHDAQGIHSLIWENYGDERDAPPPPGKPIALASYLAGSLPEAYLEFAALDDPLPAMPLFLDLHAYVNVPLATTYDAAYRGVPAIWREVLEGPTPSTA